MAEGGKRARVEQEQGEGEKWAHISPAFKAAKADKMAEVRVALRVAERAEWIGNIYEIKYLQEQAESVRREHAYRDESAKEAELDLIIAQVSMRGLCIMVE